MIISKYYLYFIVYSFLGWIYETCYCTIHEKSWENRGFLYGPCIPLYGAGATLAQIIFVDYPIPFLRDGSYLKIFLGCAIGSFFLEYGTSFILEKRFHARWWDYSHMPLNINGRVCVPFTICFGFAGILVTQIIIPPIENIVQMLPVLVVELLALIFMFLFGMDMALTISTLTSFAKDFERINEQINTQMSERVAALTSNLEAAKLKEQISTEAVKQWIVNATEPERGQFRHIAKFTHPVASIKELMEKGSDFLRNRKKKQ